MSFPRRIAAAVFLCALVPAPAAADPSPAAVGRFSTPFAEPTVAGEASDEKCVNRNGTLICKPAAGSATALPDGRVLYWNALEGTERGHWGRFPELGTNDESRVLDLRPDPFAWSVPSPADGGANPEGLDDSNERVIPAENESIANDGALFCSDQNALPDGRIIAVGGSSWFGEPTGPIGAAPEAEGIRNARIYDPRNDTWTQTGSMNEGRWYPTAVTLGDGRQFVASGARKAVKPVYPGHPEDSLINVRETETYDPDTGRWDDNGDAAARSLPLYPRLHLLPNGHVFFNVGGQAFNPGGGSYDEGSWNEAAAYDPESRSWSTLGVPGQEDGDRADIGYPDRDATALGIPGGGRALTIPGFRGSTFSVMLPLRAARDGRYTKARFLTGGGVLNPPTPGSYLPTSDSRISTVDLSGERPRMRTAATGDMTRPRWYTSGVLLPTGDVFAVSGSDRDHVMAPGFDFAIKQAELFDAATRTWRPAAVARNERAYHNTAVLLPDASVLVGGHIPLPTVWFDQTQVPGAAPSTRDPSFEIYEPPYLFRRGRPQIASVVERPGYGKVFGIRLSRRVARSIESVALVRNGSATHLVDGDQRSIELRILRRRGNLLLVAAPPDGNVAPPGPYMLFVNRRTSSGLVPSKSAQLVLGADEAPRGARRARITR